MGTRIRPPKGAKLIHADTTYMSVYKPNDTFVERMVIEYKGQEFQIHRHDRSDESILLFVGQRGVMTNMNELDALIESYC
jgi:hypothetical protein